MSLKVVCLDCGYDGLGRVPHRVFEVFDGDVAREQEEMIAALHYRCGRCQTERPVWRYDRKRRAVIENCLFDAETGKPWHEDEAQPWWNPVAVSIPLVVQEQSRDGGGNERGSGRRPARLSTGDR